MWLWGRGGGEGVYTYCMKTRVEMNFDETSWWIVCSLRRSIATIRFFASVVAFSTAVCIPMLFARAKPAHNHPHDEQCLLANDR